MHVYEKKWMNRHILCKQNRIKNPESINILLSGYLIFDKAIKII